LLKHQNKEKKQTFMLKTKTYIIITLLTFGLVSCGGENEKENHTSDETTESHKQDKHEKETKGISLTKIESFAKFPDAKLMLKMPEKEMISAGENQFQFGVENYELKQQTSDAKEMGLANSAKGQHVHFILNNGPYGAKYDKEFTKELPVGDHLMLAFLSRSYHMAVKNEHSYVLKKFRVGEPTEDQKMEVDFEAPHLFYSRPKGTYSGGDTQKVLLDFFLINNDLAEDGNKVKATINGEEFTINDWAPYAIEGLPMGENTISLQLVDSEGNYIEGPFNKVERTITLEQ
jgi:hypothetical protein